VDTDGNVYVAGSSDASWGSPILAYSSSDYDTVVAKLNADSHQISGNAGVAGATLSYTDGVMKTATSAADGNYSLTVSYGWWGTVTPSKPGFSFLAVKRSYAFVTGDLTAQNYAAASPVGSITTVRPTYSWTKVKKATQYQYQVWKGTSLVYTQTVAASACGTDLVLCSNNPGVNLAYAIYQWRYQAQVGGAWQAYTPFRTFKIPLKPKAGFWKGMSGDVTFYVTPDQAHVVQFTVTFRNRCGRTQFTRTIPGPLSLTTVITPQLTFTRKFLFTGAFYGSGAFTTPSRVSGTAGYKFSNPTCDTGLQPWAASWKNTNQP
jgi:hypothetical protein